MKHEIDERALQKVNDAYPNSVDPRISDMRARARELALAILEYTPLSREQALAMTSLEQAIAFATQAIARHEPDPAGDDGP